MKLKTNILFSLLLCGTFATAQNLKLDILPPSVTLGQDSATVFMKMTLNVPQMDTKSHIRLTPVLTDGTRTAELPQILLNGERAHRLYRRTLALNKRKGKADVTPVFTAIPLTDSDQTIHYRASLPAADWIQFATLNLKKEVINGSGEKVQSENIPIPDTAPHIATATDHFVPQRDRNREAPMAASSPSAPVVPGQLGQMLRRILRQGQDHGGVGIVAAGMHPPGMDRGVGQVRGLRHRKRVQLRPKCHGIALPCVEPGADAAGDGREHPAGQRGQNALDQLNRLRQLVIQLRDAVQGTAVIDGGHGQDLPF